uniref:RRM domain-containing protein n=1 Tax=Caenorhabditis tropicalis TaxID=1561998 RepID=A0A1I7TVR2_9PELO
MQEERGRSAYRPNCHGLSNYYRERFGSHSPELYMNLRISGFDDRLEREEIKKCLTNELKKFAPFEIKVVKNPEEDERLAYVNFERDECARKVRYGLMNKLKAVLGKHVQCDPAGILRDQEGKYIPDRFNRTQHGDKKDNGIANRNRPQKEPSTWRLKKDDVEATRTLFVGNMPSDVKEREIRAVFEAYGKVEEVDIKTPINTDAAYAFVMFQTVDQAKSAKAGEQERSLRNGGSRMKIGYGKSQLSRRLFVGGLGSWCDKEILRKAFGEHGLIENIEYVNGEPYAYVVFESTHASQEALQHLRGVSLTKSNQSIMVDYAKDLTAQPEKQQFMRKRRASKSPVGANGPRTPPGSPKDIVRNFEELDATYAPTWSGKMALKKTDYPVKFYRVYGAERLVIKLLRDEDDAPLRLLITQRLSLASQNLLFEKLSSCSSKELSLGVITGKKELLDLQPLVNYFTNKDAAGVVTVPGGILYIFPFCEFALKLLAEFTPQVQVFNENCPFLLGALAVRAPGTPTS